MQVGTTGVEMRSATIQIVRLTMAAALLVGLHTAAEQTGELLPFDDEMVIEEVLVTAIDRCGPWPIAHRAITECAYPELKKDRLRELRDLRERYFDTCLICTDATCSPRSLPEGARRQKFVCKRLFQTPKFVPRTQLRSVDVGYLAATFSYNITANGKAENIQFSYIESDLEDDVVLQLIRQAAVEARFEPIRYQGKRLPLVGLEDSYNLEQ